MDDHREQEETEARRPRVIDKRISARGTTQAAPADEAPAEAAPAEAPPPRAAQEEPPAAVPTQPQQAATPPHPQGLADAPAPQVGNEADDVWTPEREAEARRMLEDIARTPSLDWVLQTAVTLANVAGTKLDAGATADAQLAIDALNGIIQSVGSRLQDAEQPLRQTLAQLQLAYAQSLPGTAPPQQPS